MSNKIVFYCSERCCGGGACWGETHVKRLSIKHNIVWEKASNNIIDRYTLSVSPTMLFLQDDVVFRTVYGFFMEDQLEDKMSEVRWAPPRPPRGRR